ncbi:MAG TPA: ribonuclease HI [Tepidisphaeraceae bacterium]|nr:ribonuclease HI [Tepidisphaeraceae bacterium]
MPELQTVIVYTDGACDPNPGIGGWAAMLMVKDRPDIPPKLISGGEAESTNNRMEMTAVIEALKSLKTKCRVILNVDSEYVMNAFTKKWLEGWKKRGWKTSDRKPVKNQDLWEKLEPEVQRHEVVWNWIRGHHVDELNIEVDEAAVAARLKIAADLRKK